MITIRKLSYSKESKGLDLNPETNIGIKSNPIISNSQSNIKSLEGYEKTDGKLSYTIMLVISEGEEKEKKFLKEIEDKKKLNYNNLSLRVKFISKENEGLKPCKIQEEWGKIKKDKCFEFDGSIHTLLDDDKVYLVSDVDEYYDKLKGLVPNETRAQWIISNPCFEMWLYYCYKNKPETDLENLESLDVAQRSQRLKTLLNNIISGGANPCDAFYLMKTGISNSKGHYCEDENKIPKLYATKMHEMAEYIIKTLNNNNNEFNELLKTRSELREKWIKNK